MRYNDEEIIEGKHKKTRKVNGYEVQIMNNGKYQLAMVPINGWDLILKKTTL